MDLKITTTETTAKHHTVSAIAIAALIAGRTAEIENKAVTPELAFLAAAAFFAEAGVTDLETYLAHRAEVKTGLRDTAEEIRGLKKTLRPMDGNCQGYWNASAELGQAIARFKKLHDTRVLGKAWSAEARRRADAERSVLAAC